MKILSKNSLRILGCLSLSILPVICWSDRSGKMDASLLIPYFNGKNIEFEGGSSAEFNSDPGFGFGMAYNYSNQLATRFDVTFNSISYDGTRIVDDGANTPRYFSSSIDTFNLKFGGDYYLTPGKFAPYLHAGFGWSFIDTNIPVEPPVSACWWDPWYGYICSDYTSTYTESSLFYGVGAGLRIEFLRSSFIKIGYFQDYIDFDRSEGTVDLDSFRIEIGSSY